MSSSSACTREWATGASPSHLILFSFSTEKIDLPLLSFSTEKLDLLASFSEQKLRLLPSISTKKLCHLFSFSLYKKLRLFTLDNSLLFAAEQLIDLLNLLSSPPLHQHCIHQQIHHHSQRSNDLSILRTIKSHCRRIPEPCSQLCHANKIRLHLINNRAFLGVTHTLTITFSCFSITSTSSSTTTTFSSYKMSILTSLSSNKLPYILIRFHLLLFIFLNRY